MLAAHPKVKRVLYPGRADHPQYEIARKQMSSGGTLVAFEVEGGKAGAFAMANALSIIGISNNLGDAKSLITHPETTTHQRLKPEQRAALGIGPGLLRLSVGLEDVEDLIEDLAARARRDSRHAASGGIEPYQLGNSGRKIKRLASAGRLPFPACAATLGAARCSSARGVHAMHFIYWIILGLIAGFIASRIVNQTGSGIVLDTIIGVVGAVIGGFIGEKLGLGRP